MSVTVPFFFKLQLQGRPFSKDSNPRVKILQIFKNIWVQFKSSLIIEVSIDSLALAPLWRRLPRPYKCNQALVSYLPPLFLTEPSLWRKIAIFKRVWQTLKLLPHLKPFGLHLLLLKAFKWGTIWPYTTRWIQKQQVKFFAAT